MTPLRLALALILACALAPAAHAADKLRVGKGVPFAWTFIPVDVGKEIGVWDAAGIAVEIIGFQGAAKQQQALIAGSVDIGLGSGPSMGFTAKGAPAHGVAAFAGPPLSLSVVVGKDSPIKTVDQLKGTKTGVTTAGSLSDWAGKRVAMVQGWGPNGITTVALGGLEPSLAALRTKQIDSLILATEEGYQLEEKGEGRIVTNVGKYGTDFHTHVIFARDALIKDKPELIQRFVNGWFTTIAWMKANREKAIALSGKVLSLSPTVLAKTYDDEIGMMSDDGVFDPKALAVLKPSLVEMGILDHEPKDDEMFTPKFVPAKKIAFTPKL
jgi:ABC-type nitrate/sulfonate/bicarbonate transport system substrate-binding protein